MLGSEMIDTGTPSEYLEDRACFIAGGIAARLERLRPAMLSFLPRAIGSRSHANGMHLTWTKAFNLAGSRAVTRTAFQLVEKAGNVCRPRRPSALGQ